ncbi:MAG: hypothetical protein HQL80_05670 [Magnetococcales bacterium]|nr:hypothetical protein [Magnetococcales bacterium]MBF0583709.1 hypothetical protein [Magnetococcales bacterium]
MGAIFYGFRLLWGALFPGRGGVGGRFIPAAWERVLGRGLLLVLVVLLVLMAIERLQVSGETPADLTVAPPLSGRVVAPDGHY